MRRAMRPGLLLTASVVSIATSEREEPEITHNPPALQTVKWTMPTGPFQKGSRLNLVDDRNRTIYTNGTRCWIEVPFDTPPTSVMPLPTEQVECPEPYTKDPAWAQCSGEIAVADAGCECFVMGNPPPPKTEVNCPQIPGLATERPMGTGTQGG